MKRLLVLACAGTLALVGLSHGGRAEDPRPSLRVASLVRQLGSPSYTERESAEDALAELGAESRAELELAALDDDPEIRQRAKDLLLRLRVADLWSPTPFTYQAEATPAVELLGLLTRQTGNQVLIGEQFGQFSNLPVTLDCRSTPFWQAVDEVCRLTNNHIRPHFDPRKPGLVIVSGETGGQPVTYSGPVRSQITSARRVFIEELNYENGASDLTHTFQLNLQMMWEDRFRLVAYRSQPELVEALTEDGVNLTATQTGGSSWNVAGPGTRQASMGLRLAPPPESAERLAVLTIRWGLIAVGDMATLEVGNLSSPETHYQDDLRLVVEPLSERQGNRHEIVLIVSRDLIVPEPQEIVFQENQVELFDEQGRPFAVHGQSNSLTDRGAQMKLTFTGDNTLGKPHHLRLHYPRIRAHKDLEITFRNVPLPGGRPD